MSNYYAYVDGDLACPFCAAVVTDALWFRWGYVDVGYAPQARHVYRVGDPIRWKACRDGKAPAWVYFYEGGLPQAGGRPAGANSGDPRMRDVLAKDCAQFFWDPTLPDRLRVVHDPVLDGSIIYDPVAGELRWSRRDPTKPRPCAQCGGPLEGAVVEIRGGVIRGARICLPGEFAPEIDLYLISADGTLTPMPEWGDHPMDILADC